MRVDLVARTKPSGSSASGNRTERLLLDAAVAPGRRGVGRRSSASFEPSMRSDQSSATALAALSVVDADAAIGPADAAVGSVVGSEKRVDGLGVRGRHAGLGGGADCPCRTT